MYEAIQLGPFIVKVQWIILVISGIFGYIILLMGLKDIKPINKVIEETIINSVVIAGLIWKLSLILFEPIKFINNPLTLIYFSGGIRGELLAVAVAAGYLIYSSYKQGVSVWLYADSITAVFLAGTAIFNLISAVISRQYAVFYVSRALLSLLLLIWQMKGLKITGKPENLNRLLMWLSLGEIFIFHLKAPNTNNENLVCGFPLQQLLLYILSVFTIIINFVLERKRSNS